MTRAIALADVSFRYQDRRVLDAVTLSIDEGSFFGLLGPNGGGKTTLLKIMLGLLSPDTGTAQLFGEPATAFDDGERLGYVSQDAAESDRSMPVTVRQVVRMGRYPHAGLNGLTATDEERVTEALSTVGITEIADRRVGSLSGGQRQRTFIARALAAEADLLALDEPTVGVDAEARERFYALLDRLNGTGITVVLIEHDIGVVLDHADHVGWIDRSLRYVGDPSGLLESETLATAPGALAGAGVI